MSAAPYDSRPATIAHARRVAQLLAPLVEELRERGEHHDESKLHPPELAIVDEFTPKLREHVYGSTGYFQVLGQMKLGLDHHFAHNRHHPEHFGDRGIGGMTLVDLLEMLADWRAATERNPDGSLDASLQIQQHRFGIDEQLLAVLWNTAEFYGWLDADRNQVAAKELL